MRTQYDKVPIIIFKVWREKGERVKTAKTMKKEQKEWSGMTFELTLFFF